MEVWIDGEDKEYWGIELQQNIDFQIKSQIINWFMMEQQTQMRSEVIKHINKEVNTQITKIDRPIKLYEAKLSTNAKTFEPGNEIGDNILIGSEHPYFYIGITSSEQAFGEYKLLVKNTLGPSSETQKKWLE
ncbi:hypothetical protein [Spiroplasma monobiae]|uniref:Uncharacterized protein n=1 Tax=Spiroplasma monobiae MQ-1 TaxID=1336748 RepID=A0A2K9LV66_SPISQ|nr:hypothetical protein [Spiroplasma monobiae]AUM62920.1 hypothetical protein SMONO_v1c06710 [Spiroplasma monobiae MQ-1]